MNIQNAPKWLSVNEKKNWSNVRNLQADQVQEIRKVSFWNVQYMDSKQMKQRTRLQRVTYAIGVLILGVVTAPFAIIAFVAFKILFISNVRPFKWTLEKLRANPIRLGAYIGTCVGDDWFKP